MKKLITLMFSLLIVTAFAQNRPGTSKPYPPVAGSPSASISVVGLGSGGLTPAQLVAALVGPGVTYSNISYVGTQSGTATASAGTFANGTAILGFDEGVCLCSGYISNGVGPNNAPNTTGVVGTGGDADLNALVGGSTQDACVLEFDFVPTGNEIFVQYAFGSEEYNEYVGSNFNDAFAFFLDGVNIAKITGTSLPVSINNVNLGSYPQFYNNNSPIPGTFDLEADGFTKVFVAQGAVTPNVSHHIKLVIADKGDSSLDSWVWLHGASFSTVNPNIPTLSQWGLIILGLTLLGFGTFYIMRMKA